MTRNDKVLQHIKQKGWGIEIGPSHAPIAPKKEGHAVHIIDHMSREQLIEKYQGHNVNLDNIEEVDYVWQGESYVELTGKPKHYDWIIASHLIEHTPDLIGFLNDCDAILKDDGVISLVVPDKRYCFDHYRPVTGLSKIIDSHFSKSNIHSPGTVAEFCLNAVLKAGELGWHAGTGGEYSLAHSLDNARDCMKSVLQDKIYMDMHAWCFVPHSFRLIIHDLFSLGLIPFQEVDFHSTDGYEFYITLGRQGKGINISRLDMLENIELEIKDLPPPVPEVPSAKRASLMSRVIRRAKRSFT